MAKWNKRSGTLEDYLWKNEQKNRSKVVKEGTKNAKLASLDYEVLKYNPEIDLSVLKIDLWRPEIWRKRPWQANCSVGISIENTASYYKERNDFYLCTRAKWYMEDIRRSEP